MARLAARRSARQQQSQDRYNEGVVNLQEKHSEQLRELDANRARLNHDGLEVAKGLIQQQIIAEVISDQRVQDENGYLDAKQNEENEELEAKFNEEVDELKREQGAQEINDYDEVNAELSEV
ncbi:MAG: hypothetical protein V2I33_16765 [Kangiellaceae bacterium]|jgi:hypothetical protein|nr:hypothetical protein [Kangiellaceae bacterium]